MKWPKLKRNHVGLTIRTLVKLQNGFGEVPIGTVCKVTSSRGGLNLRSEPCPHCGLRAFISHVPYHKVLLVQSKEN